MAGVLPDFDMEYSGVEGLDGPARSVGSVLELMYSIVSKAFKE